MPGEGAAIASTICAAAEAATLEELHESVLPRLLEVASAHAALLYRFDERGVSGLAGNLREPVTTLYTRELFESDPIQRALMAMPDLPPVLVSTRLPGIDRNALRRSLAYSDFYRPFEMEHLLGAPLTPGLRYGQPGMSGILLASQAGADFDDRVKRRMIYLLPALRAAARRIERFEAEQRKREAVEAILGNAAAAPHLALDLRGRKLWVSPGAEALLAAAGFARELPDELRAAAASFGAVVQGELGVAPRFEITLPGPLRAVLSLARSAAGAQIVVVALDEPAPEAVYAQLARRFGLTRAETRTLALLALGHSNAELARRQHVSVETVRTHVSRLLGKLGVRSREEAARVARFANRRS